MMDMLFIFIILVVFAAMLHAMWSGTKQAGERLEREALEEDRCTTEAEEHNALPAPEEGLGKPCPFIDFKPCTGTCVHFQKSYATVERYYSSYRTEKHAARCKLWNQQRALP